MEINDHECPFVSLQEVHIQNESENEMNCDHFADGKLWQSQIITAALFNFSRNISAFISGNIDLLTLTYCEMWAHL